MNNISDESGLSKKYKLSMLYDFYGELLKEHHKEIFEDYIFNDLSLSEIAVDKGISRQGVHDIVKRTSAQLEQYEDRLKLICRYDSIKEQVRNARDIITDVNKDINNEKLNTVDSILQDILEKI